MEVKNIMNVISIDGDTLCNHCNKALFDKGPANVVLTSYGCLAVVCWLCGEQNQITLKTIPHDDVADFVLNL
jgi:RNase P subunit RPR2